MFTVLKIVGEVLKSNLVASIVQALITNVHVSAPSEAITVAVRQAAADTCVGRAAESVIGAIGPALRTWTRDELVTAEHDWAAQRPLNEITAESAFAAGVAWCLAHQTASLAAGSAQAVAPAPTEAPKPAAQATQDAVPGVSGPVV